MAYKNLKTESVKKKKNVSEKKKSAVKKVKSQKKPKSTKIKIEKVVIKKEIKLPIKKEIASSEHNISISDSERSERYKTLHDIAVNVVNRYNKSNRGKMIICMWCGNVKFYKSEACAKCGRF